MLVCHPSLLSDSFDLPLNDWHLPKPENLSAQKMPIAFAYSLPLPSLPRDWEGAYISPMCSA